jgi:hypothetical protein
MRAHIAPGKQNVSHLPMAEANSGKVPVDRTNRLHYATRALP